MKKIIEAFQSFQYEFKLKELCILDHNNHCIKYKDIEKMLNNQNMSKNIAEYFKILTYNAAQSCEIFMKCFIFSHLVIKEMSNINQETLSTFLTLKSKAVKNKFERLLLQKPKTDQQILQAKKQKYFLSCVLLPYANLQLRLCTLKNWYHELKLKTRIFTENDAWVVLNLFQLIGPLQDGIKRVNRYFQTYHKILFVFFVLMRQTILLTYNLLSQFLRSEKKNFLQQCADREVPHQMPKYLQTMLIEITRLNQYLFQFFQKERFGLNQIWVNPRWIYFNQVQTPLYLPASLSSLSQSFDYSIASNLINHHNHKNKVISLCQPQSMSGIHKRINLKLQD